MKSLFLLVALLLPLPAALHAARRIVISSGFTFSIPLLTISAGDTGTHYYIRHANILSGGQGRIVVNEPAPQPAAIPVRSVAGRDCLALNVDGVEGPGERTLSFDGSGLPGGVDVVRIPAGGKSGAGNTVLMK